MRKLVRILPIIFLMTMLFACKKETFTPPYMNGPFTPPYLLGNQEQTHASEVKDSTKNRDF